MKGIAHFAAGVAIASFFPEAVRAGEAGQALPFVFGGICGLLPDTIDFRFVRFFQRYDMEVIPDPLDPDPAVVAEALAHAMRRALESGTRRRIKFRTVRLGADRWLQYGFRIDPARSAIAAWIGPAVNTSRRPVAPLPATGREHLAALPGRAIVEYRAETLVDILDGPSFDIEPAGDGAVRLRFIPWHREWSHSLLTALIPAAVGWFLGGIPMALIGLLAFWAHVAVDQAGFLGASLFSPFSRKRWGGLHLLRSDAPVANFAAVWLSILVILWNLSRLGPASPVGLSLLHLLLYGAALPLLAVAALRRLPSRKAARARAR